MKNLMRTVRFFLTIVVLLGASSIAAAAPKPKPARTENRLVTPGGSGNEAGGEAESKRNDFTEPEKIDSYVEKHRRRADFLQKFATDFKNVCSDPKNGFGDYNAIRKAATKAGISDLDHKPLEITSFKNETCNFLCATAGQALPIDFCAFADASAAHAAVIADWDSAAAIIRYINSKLERLREEKSKLFDFALQNSEIQTYATMFQLDADRQRFESKPEAAGEVLTLATFSADALRVGLSALARVIVDRAKRESIGFFLQHMGDRLCNQPDANIKYELRTYWFPALCALAANGGSYMLQYGGGSRLLSAFRAAVESDLSGWPGAGAGLVLGQAFNSCSNKCPFTNKNLQDDCNACEALRKETQRLISDLLSGKNFAAALSEFGGSFDELSKAKDKLYNDSFQFAACAASMPLYFQQYDGALSKDLGTAERARSILLAGFASAPACWTLFGKGIKRETCEWFGGNESNRSQCKKEVRPGIDTGPLERLSTVLRLHRVLGRASYSVGQRVSLLNGALKQYKAAMDAPSVVAQVPGVTIPKMEITSVDGAREAMAAMKSYAQGMELLGELRAYQRKISAAAAVASASLSLADSALVAASEARTKVVLGQSYSEHERLNQCIAEARTHLDLLQRGVDSVAAVARQEWGAAATRSLALLRGSATEQCSGNSTCAKLSELGSRFAPVLIAVATEKDPDAVAEAIEQAASPPGGWKRKMAGGTFMLSLTAHAGIMGGFELRHGQYGVVRENFKQPYGVAPVLMLPVGLEFTWGRGYGEILWGLFLSLIDPVAFLEYDSSEDGRLPGPSLTTVLAPGIAVRFGIPSTPFSVLPYIVYRPGLRAWDPAIAGPAASALQFGVGLSVDVTLIDIVVQP